MKKEFNILEEIKPIEYIIENKSVSIEQVANYYEVTKDCISTVIERHRNELESNSILVLKGEDLKELKKTVNKNKIKSKTRSLTLINGFGMMLIGFYLQNNKITEKLKEITLQEDAKLYQNISNITKNTCLVKRYENEFYNIIHKILGKYNKIEKQVHCGTYYIDFVINDTIAIEIDENGHSHYDQEKEKNRELFLRNSGYEIYRFNPMKEDVLEFIGEIVYSLQLIMKFGNKIA